LPHFDSKGKTQFLTWRQIDAVPKDMVVVWQEELKAEKDEHRVKELRRRVEKYCDAGYGSCLLKDPRAAEATVQVLQKHAGVLYNLRHWVLMPNHVHLLLTPLEQISLEKIAHQLKGESAREINRALGRLGSLWAIETFDRYIRNEDHFLRTAQYIEGNPVKAGLCELPESWPWSSAAPDAE